APRSSRQRRSRDVCRWPPRPPITPSPLRQRKPSRSARTLLARPHARMNLGSLKEILRTEHLPDFRLALPARPMLPVELHEAPRPLDRFLLRLQLEHGIPADD